MSGIDYPQELKKAFWDKKKGALEGAAALETALKVLEKKHEGMVWASVAPGWPKAAGTDAAKLKALYEGLDKLYRTKALPLRLEAQSLVTMADKAGKAKEATKPLKEACVAMVKAATVYAKAVAEGLDALTREYELAAKALPSPKGKGDDEEDDEPSSALTDPKRMLKQLQLCKVDAERKVNFAMVSDGKQDPVLALHHRLTGRAMLAKLIKETGIKLGAFGLLSVDRTIVLIEVEKMVPGLAKRIRIPLRQCGFKFSKVRQVDEKGQSLEEELDDSDTSGDGVSPAAFSAAPKPSLPAINDALKAWSQAREAVIIMLKEAAKDIAALKDPESAKAVIEISAVVKNLTPEPRSPQQVAELIRYINQDDVVLDVSDFASDIRTPLLKALAQLHKAVSA